jgi:hypothetical protein
MQRAAVIVVVGYYQVLGQSLGFPIVARTGGHVMTLTRARRLGMNCAALCRDPADDLVPPAGPQTWITQDGFRDRAFTAVDGWVLYAQPGFPLHYRYIGTPVGTCPDFDGDGVVGFSELIWLLSAWGPLIGYDPADVDLDFVIGFPDLIQVLSRWGPCPDP